MTLFHIRPVFLPKALSPYDVSRLEISLVHAETVRQVRAAGQPPDLEQPTVDMTSRLSGIEDGAGIVELTAELRLLQNIRVSCRFRIAVWFAPGVNPDCLSRPGDLSIITRMAGEPAARTLRRLAAASEQTHEVIGPRSHHLKRPSLLRRLILFLSGRTKDRGG
jgi:hypothetical protein